MFAEETTGKGSGSLNSNRSVKCSAGSLPFLSCSSNSSSRSSGGCCSISFSSWLKLCISPFLGWTMADMTAVLASNKELHTHGEWELLLPVAIVNDLYGKFHHDWQVFERKGEFVLLNNIRQCSTTIQWMIWTKVNTFERPVSTLARNWKFSQTQKRTSQRGLRLIDWLTGCFLAWLATWHFNWSQESLILHLRSS